VKDDRRRKKSSVVSQARSQFSETLGIVRDRLASGVATSHPVRIHKLRVATRRSLVAMQTFEDYLPRKVFKQAKRNLRIIRRTAGRLRDWDVFKIGLTDWIPNRSEIERPGLDILLDWAEQNRETTRFEFNTVATTRLIHFDRVIDRTVDGVRPPRKKHRKRPSVKKWIQKRWNLAVTNLTEAATQEITNDEQLHRVRILGKRVRYLIELFGKWITTRQKRASTQMITELQETLGNFNDAVVSLKQLDEFTTYIQTIKPEALARIQAGIAPRKAQQLAIRELGRVRFYEWQRVWAKLAESAETPGNHQKSVNNEQSTGV
jgi:triphosphatase